MGSIAMGEDQSIESIYAASTQIRIQHAFVIAYGPGVEQPILAGGPEMQGPARAQIERVNFQDRAARPVRMLDIKMAGGNLSEQLDGPEDKFCQHPISVLEND